MAVDEKAQMMTIEAFLGAVLIIAALLFVVSQVPVTIQQSNPHSKTQLYHYGEDIIMLLKTNASPDPYYDNLMQYYIGEKKFDELSAYIADVLPDNIGYNVAMHDGRKGIVLIRDEYPAKESITVSRMAAIKSAPISGIGRLFQSRPWYSANSTFGNGSLIIPMDDKQNNNITAYNLIRRISALGIPVYQLVQDPRDRDLQYWEFPRPPDSLRVTDDPWNESSGFTLKNYAGGPYIIDKADLTPVIKNQIKVWAEDPIDVPSIKIDTIEFQQDMDVVGTLNITFTLNDGSTRTVNLSTTDSTIVCDGSSVGYSGNNYSHFLHIDTASIAFDDRDKNKIIGIVMANTAPFNVTISKISLTWTHGGNLQTIAFDGKKESVLTGSTAVVNKIIQINHNDPANRVTVHRAGEDFNYKYTTWLTRSPIIGVYPEAGTMTNYYADSGISYDVLDSSDMINGNLKNYDILFMPHVNAPAMSLNETRNLVDWVSSGGLLLAECAAAITIEDEVEIVDNHSWYGFIGIRNAFSFSDSFKFVGHLAGETGNESLFLSHTERNGSALHPLSQSYTEDGSLPNTTGTAPVFGFGWPLASGKINIYNSILAVPEESGNIEISYIEAPFDRGTVIYLAGHDQSSYSQQRERLIFNSIFYSTTAKQYSYGLTEIHITTWYK